MKYLATAVLSVFALGVVLAPSAMAQDTALGNLQAIGNASGQTTEQSLTQTIGGVIQFILGLLGIIALVIVIYAGFLWMFGGANSDNVSKAKSLMINGVIGLAIILAAYSITTFVFEALGEATGTTESLGGTN
jgi:uncharacterized membrane protein YjgN (DUF898 family)